jgi:hypothetical protein
LYNHACLTWDVMHAEWDMPFNKLVDIGSSGGSPFHHMPL